MSLSQEAEDELLSVSMIYPDMAIVESSKTLLVKPNDSFEIRFILSPKYPDEYPPSIEVSAPSIPPPIKAALKSLLENCASENRGNCMLYELVSKVKEFVDEYDAQSSSKSDLQQPDLLIEDANLQKTDRLNDFVPEIYGTDILTDRKSVFQAHIGKIESKEQAMVMLKHLMSNSKIARATHRIYAYRTFVSKNGKLLPLHDCEDDGEIGAGSKVLNLLQLMDCENVMVVVTRWYGGIHLGPDRFKHILNLARKAIVNSGFVNNPKVNAAAQKQ